MTRDALLVAMVTKIEQDEMAGVDRLVRRGPRR